MYPTYHAWGSTPYLHGLAFLLLWPVIVVLVVWTLVIKGFALWYAARNHQKAWFVLLLVVNTLGILELVYLIWFRKDHNHGAAAHHSSAA
jgi:methionyl-tRNA synthetase